MGEMDYKDAARKLWMLLDDIDTLDDACRSDDAAFRRHTREVQRKRFGILSGEQMDALLADAAGVTAVSKDQLDRVAQTIADFADLTWGDAQELARRIAGVIASDGGQQ